MTQYTLQKGGIIKYYPKFLSEELCKELFNELKGTQFIQQPSGVKNNKGEEIILTYSKAESGVIWSEIVANMYDNIIKFPRFTALDNNCNQDQNI